MIFVDILGYGDAHKHVRACVCWEGEGIGIENQDLELSNYGL